MESPLRPGSLTVLFGAESSRIEMDDERIQARMALPVLGPVQEETIMDRSRSATRTEGPFSLIENDDQLAGAALVRPGGGMEATTFHLYETFFSLLGGEWYPYRVWHYVPAINDPGPDGLEHYRSFNLGRSRAFETHFGQAAHGHMPAASAVGTDDDQLALLFMAGRQSPRYIENPEQVPAYEYPGEHGPRPPSFARGTCTAQCVYVSGTASIKGHRTVSPGDLAGQFETTLDNLRLVVGSAHGPDLEELVEHPNLRLKVYLRNRARLSEVAELMKTHLGANETNTLYLEAAICRGDLDLEIEMTYGR
ncbi:MAG: hypothetical protein AAF514_02285 [Verrucomicrobiota bacterium]